jgi:hypothetical protein
MRKLINTKTAGNVLLALFGLLVAFHIIILFNLLPSNVVWGGQAGGSPSSLRTLETFSLIFTVLFAIVVAAKIGYIKVGKLSRVINVLLWIIFAYLLVNTVGNLASNSSVETLLFTPITIVAALLVFRLAIENNSTSSPTRI